MGWLDKLDKYKDGGKVKKPSFEDYYKTVPQDKNDTVGYNLRAAFDELPYSKLQKFVVNKDAHLPDTYKNPSHFTFSDESKYSNDSTKGGHWGFENGHDTFTPTPFNLQQHSLEELQQYFKNNEPNAVLKYGDGGITDSTTRVPFPVSPDVMRIFKIDQPGGSQKDTANYLSALKSIKDNGDPKITFTNKSAKFAPNRPEGYRSRYSSNNNEIIVEDQKINDPRTLLLNEVPHAKQFQIDGWDNKPHPEEDALRKQYNNIRLAEGDRKADDWYDKNYYNTPGTNEYNAHKEIAPVLIKEWQRVRDSTLNNMPHFGDGGKVNNTYNAHQVNNTRDNTGRVPIIDKNILEVQAAYKAKNPLQFFETSNPIEIVDNNKSYKLPDGQRKTFDKMDWREKNYVRGAALKQRSHIEGIPDIVNPLSYVADVASGLAQSPYEARESNSNLPYATAVGVPLALGAVETLAAPYIKKGTDKIGKYLTEETALKNAYKLNPTAWKPNPEMGYRLIGDAGYTDALESGVLRAKPAPVPKDGELIKIGNSEFNLAKNTNRNPNTGRIQNHLDRPYFSDGFVDERYGRGYLAEVNKADNNLVTIPTHKGIAPINGGDISLNNVNFYKPDWLKGYKEILKPVTYIESNVAPQLGKPNITQGLKTEAKNIQNHFSSAIKGTGDVVYEAVGELFNGKQNREAIDKGNAFLHRWITHPSTVEKVEKDMEKAYYFHGLRDKDPGYIDVIKDQTLNFIPETTEYPLNTQVKDNLKQYFYKNTKKNIHYDNNGVNYTHSINPIKKYLINQGVSDASERYGSFVSRGIDIPQKVRESVAIHEGTHAWTSEEALKKSGLRNMSLSLTNPKIKSDFLTWENYREQNLNPYNFMDKNIADQAYYADPTEMHARTMELRKFFGIKPNHIVSEEQATHMIPMILNDSPISGANNFLNVIDHNPRKLAKIFNKFWGTATTGVVGSQLLPEKKQMGGGVSLRNSSCWLDELFR